MIKIFATDKEGYRFEVDDLYWFEEDGVHDWDGHGHHDKYEFEIYPQTLQGKTALVTGGGRGLGLEITKALTNLGAEVIITFKSDYASAMNATEIEGVLSPPYLLDLGNDLQIQAFSKSLAQTKIDILINNAGMNITGPIDSIPVNVVRQVVDVNLIGPYCLTSALFPLLNPNASIVWIGSVSGVLGGPTSTHYAMAKYGLEAASVGFAKFGAERGIRSNVVRAGYLESPMAEAGLQSEAVQNMVKNIPLNRLGRFEEVAQVVAWLASDQASYVTGAVIPVAGGL